MKRKYLFSYRSKLYRNASILLENLIIALATTPLFPIIDCIFLDLLDSYVIDDSLFVLIPAGVILVFLALTILYYTGEKGIEMDEDKIILRFCCVGLGIHGFVQKIYYSDITGIETCKNPVNARGEEIEGGAYHNPYVILYYKKNKQCRLPLENQDDFLKELNRKIRPVE